MGCFSLPVAAVDLWPGALESSLRSGITSRRSEKGDGEVMVQKHTATMG